MNCVGWFNEGITVHLANYLNKSMIEMGLTLSGDESNTIFSNIERTRIPEFWLGMNGHRRIILFQQTQTSFFEH